MTSKQRATLRGLASKEESIFQIGKDCISENLLSAVNEALEKRELIKLSVLRACELSHAEIAAALAEKTRSEVVATIGNRIILYRVSHAKNARHITL